MLRVRSQAVGKRFAALEDAQHIRQDYPERRAFRQFGGDGERAIEAWAEVVMKGGFGGSSSPPGFTFGVIDERPLEPGKTYTLDPDPNDIYGSWAAQVSEGLVAGGRNILYTVLAGEERPLPLWPEAGAEGQERFMAGFDALHAAGALHGFEPSKREGSSWTRVRKWCLSYLSLPSTWMIDDRLFNRPRRRKDYR